MRRMAIVGAVFLLGLWSTAPAEAALRVWKDGVTGDWNVAGNWMNGLPVPGDTVYLGKTNDSHKVTLSGSGASVAAVYGGSGLTIDGVPLTVTGSPADVTSFEQVSVVNGGAVSITGPGHYQGGLTLGSPTSSASLMISGAGVKWSGAVLEGATGSGTTTITPAADVTVEPFTNLQVLTRFQNRGKLHTDVLTEIIPSPGSLASDGDFEASATGTFSLRPGPGSTFVLDKDSTVSGAGRFEMSSLVSGGGTVRVDSGAAFAPGVLGLFSAERFELNTDAVVGKLELHSALANGGRFGTGELRATGDSLLLGTHLGGGKTVFDGPLLIQSGDASYLTDGALLRTTGTTSWLQGAVDLTAGSWENAGTINITSGILSGPGLLTNSGTIAKTGAGGFLGSASVQNSGTITVSAGRFGSDVPTGTYGVLTQSAGLTNVLAGAVLDKHVVLNGGTLKGRGTVRGLTNNGGVVEPGASPGTLSVAGAYSQGAGGVLRMEIEGAAAGTFDVLAVGGAASLGGTLDLLGAYVPAPGDQFPIVTAGTLAGTWAGVTGTAAARFGLGYGAGGVALCAAGACGFATPTPTPSPTATATASPTATATPTATASPTATATAAPQPTASPSPSATAVPQATATPGPAKLTAADLVALPSASRCVSHRTLTLRLRRPTGVKVAKATVTVGAKRPQTFTGAVTVRLPKGRTTVKVAVKLRDGRTFTVSRRYRTCAPRSRSDRAQSRSALSASSA
ncbi:hypothetical protein OM076_22320 [Solirubrobacter ginsenosidimutans]|uniref:Uncharacterized protein n=1 Tax=Solirubrobacter ginsenosidimutans TaxID=490573 RepID=A0A9X3MXB2_9ACTN|nr:hypothetical protein [Solirubrobacter ginsenosidimutans]MDA0163025.1 hypothetical protein [Solirubrobacter ginsenosidimutans]